MPLPRTDTRRAHRRSYRGAIACSLDAEAFHLWLPRPDDRLTLTEFGDVVALASELAELPVQREALALLDEHRQVTAILLDPPPLLGVYVGAFAGPGLEVPFSQTLSLVLTDHVADGAPTTRELNGYHALRRVHMLQGLLLIDLVMVSADRVRSTAIACDPDAAWFEADRFEPRGERGEPYHGVP